MELTSNPKFGETLLKGVDLGPQGDDVHLFDRPLSGASNTHCLNPQAAHVPISSARQGDYFVGMSGYQAFSNRLKEQTSAMATPYGYPIRDLYSANLSAYSPAHSVNYGKCYCRIVPKSGPLTLCLRRPTQAASPLRRLVGVRQSTSSLIVR